IKSSIAPFSPEVSIRFVLGDYTMEPTLSRATITEAAAVIILADPGLDSSGKPDERTLLATLAIKSISQDIKVYVELLDAASEVHLKRAGVDQIIISGEFSGFLLASAVIVPGIPQALKEIMHTDIGSDIRRESLPHEFIGMTFRDTVVEYYDRFGSILIGVITEKESFDLETVLSGEKGAIDDFIRRKFEEAGRDLEIESKGRVGVHINPAKEYVLTKFDDAIILTSKNEEAVV
ncbi:NAD-binding protein, partial [Candidatus Latescibacterota bacterium]